MLKPLPSSLLVQIVPNAPSTPPSLCGENSLGNADCEYVMSGMWDMSLLDYTCCAHGLSDPPALVPVMEPMQCDDNAMHSPYHLGETRVWEWV